MNTDDKLPTRRLGRSGPEVPILALGSWNTWDRMPAAEAVAMIERACDAGAGFFDVAYYNTGPHAEGSRTDLLFAEALRSSGRDRDDVVLCGKLWLWDYPRASFSDQLHESLERIGQQRLDTVVVGDYLGEPDVEGIVADVAALEQQGLIGSWGINNWRIEHTRRALDFARREGLAPPVFAQLKYSVARRSMAEGREYGDLFASGELGLQASDIFEGGILAGRLRPQRKIGADVGSIREQIAAIHPAIARRAAEFDATAAQLSLAFVLAHSAVGNVLFGASRRSQLDEGIAAVRLFERIGAARLGTLLADLQVDTSVRSDGRW
ncbi:aldo/keto reductase [Subtercola sp. YIM 133946]|uniref:aldo/keto reductase n=1 Tax=Subtercola sp. YIM 133946 TaxID=3118909 RepID=UPI002F95AE68